MYMQNSWGSGLEQILQIPLCVVEATEWGGPLDETGKTEVPWHDKDPSLLKGPERRA
jgi:hypothetical protein